jgi:MFS transporter, Spinster family, sphingosine-1-phosphate transporter
MGAVAHLFPFYRPPEKRLLSRRLSPTSFLVILTGLNLFNYIDRYVLNAVRTPMAADFGLSYGDSGRMFTAFMLGYFVTSPFFGFLGDRFSRKVLIALGIFVWSLGTVLTGFAQGFVMLLFFRALVGVGVGEASYATLSPGLISDTWAADKRNTAITIFYVAIPVGSALGYMLGGEIAGHWGWRQAFYWVGAPGLLLALVLLPFREPGRGEADGAIRGKADGQSSPISRKASVGDVARLVVNRDYSLVVWGYVAYTFALGAFAFWGPTFLQKVHGLPLDRADNFFGAVLVVAGLLGSLAGGFLATWWHRRTPAGYAFLLSLSMFCAVPVSFYALLAAGARDSMIFLGLSIFFIFFSTGPVNTLILETAPVNVRSSAMAVSIFLIHLFGDMPSPEIVGRLADRLAGDLRTALLLLPVALACAGALWLALALKTGKDNVPLQDA